jgi:hypothetical protein
MDIEPSGLLAEVESVSCSHAIHFSDEDTTFDFDSVSEQWASYEALSRIVPEYLFAGISAGFRKWKISNSNSSNCLELEARVGIGG